MADTDAVCVTNSIYKIDATYRKTAKAILTPVALLDTEAGVILLHSAPIPPE